MATNAELVATTRRLVAESAASQWDSTVRQAKLNATLALAIARIQEVAPHEFVGRATANIAVGSDGTRSRYERPTAENVRMYEIMASTGGSYRQMARITREQASVLSGDVVSYTDGTVRSSYAYYIEGEEVVIVPEPSADVTAGLRVTYTDVQVLSAAGDVPYMPASLHHLLPYGAAVLCLEESKDAADAVVDRYRARWASKFGDFDASTRESRAALALTYRIHEPRAIVGMRLG